MSLVVLPNLTARFGVSPEAASRVERLDVSAAIWSGETAGGIHELVAEADDTTHLLGVGMIPYDCEPFANGRRLHAGTWHPGRAQLMQAGVHARAVLRGRWRMLHVYIPAATIARALNLEPGALELIDPLGRADPVLERHAQGMAAEMTAGHVTSALQIEAISLSLCVHLIRVWSNHSGARATRPSRGGLAPWQVKRACEAMYAQLDGDIGLDTLAKLAGCSPTHFSRAFKQSTGKPPFQWLLERRIERAKELLSDRCLPLAEIALAVGFAAQPQFTTAFKRVTGITPGAWQRERVR